jgi:hypothetical protein
LCAGAGAGVLGITGSRFHSIMYVIAHTMTDREIRMEQIKGSGSWLLGIILGMLSFLQEFTGLFQLIFVILGCVSTAFSIYFAWNKLKEGEKMKKPRK